MNKKANSQIEGIIKGIIGTWDRASRSEKNPITCGAAIQKSNLLISPALELISGQGH